jgi:hypothetical protein
MALTKLTKNLIDGTFGTEWVSTIQTSNFTAEAAKGYFVNTTAGTITINLPAGVVGMEITIQDYAGTFATNKVILNANGSEKIQGSALEGRINTNNATAVLIYQDATKGWTSQDVTLDQTTISFATPTGQSLTYSTPSPQSSAGATGTTFPTTTFTATKAGSTISGTATIAGLPSGITAAQTITGSGVGNTLTVTLTGTFPSTDSLNTALTLSGLTIVLPLIVDYLVVAGGGGGGGSEYNYTAGGGGGAGGYRNSFNSEPSGGGNTGELALTLAIATNYTLTVGAGGGIGTPSANGLNGSNSIFSTIVSTGGGGGGTAKSGAIAPASGGGSGGGSTGYANTPGTAATSIVQGYNGNTAFGTSGGDGSGGGGGAGAIGGAGTTNTGGSGGTGLSSLITGTSITRGGGGGAGTWNGGTAGSGGNGGGGDAGTNGNGSSGTTNTGGGGGGGGAILGGTAPYGGLGGSGIVILRYPSGYTISGLSGITTTVGSDKVTTFTAGTGNIQFN